MPDKFTYHFGVKAARLPDKTWSFGSCISHSFGETYLSINFLFWSVFIGWIIKE